MNFVQVVSPPVAIQVLNVTVLAGGGGITIGVVLGALFGIGLFILIPIGVITGVIIYRRWIKIGVLYMFKIKCVIFFLTSAKGLNHQFF